MLRDLKPTLYGYYRSTAAYRVRIALGLKGLNVNHEFVHLRNGKQTSAEYLAINPAGLVPYWIEGDLPRSIGCHYRISPRGVSRSAPASDGSDFSSDRPRSCFGGVLRHPSNRQFASVEP